MTKKKSNPYRFTYTIIYTTLMVIPALFLAFLVRDQLSTNSLVFTTSVGLLIGGVFEIFATKKSSHDRFYIWVYNPKTTLGKTILGVPVEDWFLFLLVTPLLIIAAWEAVKKLVIVSNLNTFVLLSICSLILFVAYFLSYRIAKKH